jgi:hypothetical protein
MKIYKRKGSSFVLIIGLFSVFFIPFANAGTTDSFAHLNGATVDSGVDFFTRRPNQSYLTKIHNLLVALKTNKKSLAQVQRELPSGVEIIEETAKTRAMILSKFGRLSINYGYEKIEPSSIQGRWVLSIKNDQILSELLEALCNDVLVYDFMTSNDLFRLVIQPQKSLDRRHFILAQRISSDKNSGLMLEENGLASFQVSNSETLEATSIADVSVFELFKFIPERDVRTIFYDIFVDFWAGFSDVFGGHESENYRSIAESALKMLGFKHVDKIMPKEVINSYEMIFYANMLAAMGYRFNPASSNTGYFIFIESSEEREQYMKMIFKITFTSKWQVVTDEASIQERFFEFYENVAAAFKILGDLDQVPKPSFRLFNTERGRDGYGYQIPLFADPNETLYKRLYLMMDVVQSVQKKYPTELKEQIRLGRKQHWDFSTESNACSEPLRRPKRR